MQTRKTVAAIGLLIISVPAAVLAQVAEVEAVSAKEIVAVIGAIVMVSTEELVDRAVGIAAMVVQAVAVTVEDLVVDEVEVHGLELAVQECEI